MSDKPQFVVFLVKITRLECGALLVDKLKFVELGYLIKNAAWRKYRFEGCACR
jgi:hypothetical protein